MTFFPRDEALAASLLEDDPALIIPTSSAVFSAQAK
jgi:hypothetical protein